MVPAVAGGLVDAGIRMIEANISAALKVPVVLVNRPGAAGTIGINSVAKADPDGYTLAMGINSAFTVARISGVDVPYGIDDFAPIGNYAVDANVLVVNANAPWKTFEELVDYAHKNPGKLNFGTAGSGTLSALSMQVVTSHFKLDLTEVPFRGGAPLVVALAGNHVDVGMIGYSSGAAMFEDKRLRALASTSETRMALLPDVPTFAEKGLSTRGLNMILGLYAPKETPPAALKVLVEALERTIKDPQVTARLEKIGLNALYESPSEVQARLHKEQESIAALGTKPK